MKNILYLLATLLILSFAISSCNNESSDEIIVHDKTPEITAEGEYAGIWTRTIQGATDTLTAPGNIIMKADTVNISKVTFVSEELSLDITASANISYADKGYVYYNNNVTNEIGTAFYGRINGDSINTASFELKIRVGRKIQYCTFRFNGSKKI